MITQNCRERQRIRKIKIDKQTVWFFTCCFEIICWGVLLFSSNRKHFNNTCCFVWLSKYVVIWVRYVFLFDCLEWLHNVNNTKGLNTMKSNMRRIVIIFHVFLHQSCNFYMQEYSLCKASYIILKRFALLFTITFMSLKLFKTVFFGFHILVEMNQFKFIWSNSPQQEYENKKPPKDQASWFLKILFLYTQKNTASITCVY